jgi:hypothetical protein
LSQQAATPCDDRSPDTRPATAQAIQVTARQRVALRAGLWIAPSSAVVGATPSVAESRFDLFALVRGVLAGLAVSMPVYAFDLVLHPADGSIEGGPPSPNCGSQHEIVVRVPEVRLALCFGN